MVIASDRRERGNPTRRVVTRLLEEAVVISPDPMGSPRRYAPRNDLVRLRSLFRAERGISAFASASPRNHFAPRNDLMRLLRFARNDPMLTVFTPRAISENWAMSPILFCALCMASPNYSDLMRLLRRCAPRNDKILTGPHPQGLPPPGKITPENRPQR